MKKNIFSVSILFIVMSGCSSDNDDQHFTEFNPSIIDAALIEVPIVIADASDISNALKPITVLPTLPQSAVQESGTKVIDSSTPLKESTYINSYNFHLFDKQPSYPVRTTSMRIFDISTTISTSEGIVASPITHLINGTASGSRNTVLNNLVSLTGVSEGTLLGNYELSNEADSITARKTAATILLFVLAGKRNALIDALNEYESGNDWYVFLDDYITSQLTNVSIDDETRTDYMLLNEAIKAVKESTSKPEQTLMNIEDYLTLAVHSSIAKSYRMYLDLTNMTSSEAYQFAKSESYVRLNHRHTSDDTEWNFSPTVQARIETEKAKLSPERIAYIFRNHAEFTAIQKLHAELTAIRLAELGLELLGNPYNGGVTDNIALEQTLADTFSRLYQALSGSTSVINNFTYYGFGVKLSTEQQQEIYSKYLVNLPTADLTFANLYTEVKQVKEEVKCIKK